MARAGRGVRGGSRTGGGSTGGGSAGGGGYSGGRNVRMRPTGIGSDRSAEVGARSRVAKAQQISRQGSNSLIRNIPTDPKSIARYSGAFIKGFTGTNPYADVQYGKRTPKQAVGDVAIGGAAVSYTHLTLPTIYSV